MYRGKCEQPLSINTHAHIHYKQQISIHTLLPLIESCALEAHVNYKIIVFILCL